MKTLFGTVVLAIAVTAGAQQTAAPVTDSTQSPTRPLTFAEALGRALSANPDIASSAAEIDVSQALKKAAFSAVLPRLSASGNLIRNSEGVTFGSGSDQRTILPADDWSYRVTLNQPIFAGQRERRAYDQAKLGIENARETAKLTEDRVLLQVASNYLGVVEANALMGVERQNVELARGRRKQATDFYEAGETTKVDVLRAETAIQSARRRLAAAEQVREIAAGQLRTDLVLDGPIEVERPGTIVPPPPDEPALIAIAEASRPEVAAAHNNLEIAQLEVRKQRGAYLPIVTADAAYITQKSSFPTDQYGYGAIRISVPIFQGGEVAARVAAAKAREEQARLALEDVKLQVREDVRQALVALRTAETNLALARDQLAAAEAEHQQISDMYRAQEATSLDLSDAENSLAEARRAVTVGELDHELAALRAWFAAGTLKTALTEKQ